MFNFDEVIKNTVQEKIIVNLKGKEENSKNNAKQIKHSDTNKDLTSKKSSH